MGSDVLAIFSILAALLTSEFLAASVIGFMLATGRVLESWAEGQAQRQLQGLIDRIDVRRQIAPRQYAAVNFRVQGLDPAIHHSKKSIKKNGPPGQARG